MREGIEALIEVEGSASVLTLKDRRVQTKVHAFRVVSLVVFRVVGPWVTLRVVSVCPECRGGKRESWFMCL